MIKLMRYKVLYLIISVAIIIPGIFFLISHGLKLGIDFTGGALLEYQFSKKISQDNLEKYGIVTSSGERTFIIRTKPLSNEDLQKVKSELKNKYGEFEIRREENVGPTIGKELEQKAIVSVLLATAAIILYITYAFRKVPKPASSFRFGVAAIVALIHDVLVVIGIFAILGVFFNVEIDTLFVTALLTIIGFSVHDTIVVFDRIRENLPKYLSHKFEYIADVSVSQTLARSLNTSLTVVFVLTALLLFGGESIRWFTLALLIGIVSGTYSSIFNATAFLSWWEEKLGH